jgi:flagellin-like hook-associated protein FlgL
MPLIISNNSAVAAASYHLGENQKALQNSITRLASGKKTVIPHDDPGVLSVSMKLNAASTRLAGAKNNIQNAVSYLEAQDGMLENAGRILNRMAELKGLATQDPMKSTQDLESYDEEIKQLQVQMYGISQTTFNGVSLFANHTNGNVQYNSVWDTSSELVFEDTDLVGDPYGNGNLRNHHTISIHTSARGAAGTTINIHKAALLAAITIQSDDLDREDTIIAPYGFRNNAVPMLFGHVWSFASEKIEDAWGESDDTDDPGGTPVGLENAGISLGVYTQAMENLSVLRANNASQRSRLTFAADSIASYETNVRAAIGRIEDVDLTEEASNLAKQAILTQSTAAILSQANSHYGLVLTMLE